MRKLMRRLTVAAVLGVAAGVGVPADTTLAEPLVSKAPNIRCTVTLEACGSLQAKLNPLTKIESGSCFEIQVAESGTPSDGLQQTAFIWVGVGVSADTLVFGKGEAKSGVLIKCAWKAGTPKPEEKLESLKRSVPELLKDEKFLKEFPQIKKIDVSGLKSIIPGDSKCAEAIAEFAKRK